jgi:hypothetical protein
MAILSPTVIEAQTAIKVAKIQAAATIVSSLIQNTELNEHNVEKTLSVFSVVLNKLDQVIPNK